MTSTPDDPDFLAVLAAAERLQTLVPDAVLVGGSAAAIHAGHRVSFDDDHVLLDLRDRFDQVLADLEATDGWVTARLRGPVLILGSLDGVETGVRQLIRRRPLEVEVVETRGGQLRVPTLAEMLRIKAFLVLRRNATRDHLDAAALADRMGMDEAAATLVRIDGYYADQVGPGGQRVVTQLAKQLAEPQPYDLSETEVGRYRRLAPRWRDWAAVRDALEELAQRMLSATVDGGP